MMQNRNLRKCIKPHRKAKLARDELIIELLQAGKTEKEIRAAAGCGGAVISKLKTEMSTPKVQLGQTGCVPEPPCPFPENDNWLDPA